MNSGPGGSGGAYRLLTESFEDAHARLRPDAAGDTCCQDADLRNDASRLSRRIDVVLARGLKPLDVERVGEDRDDRVSVEVDGTPTRLWPSDHAGVVATFGTTTSPEAGTETAGQPSETTRPDWTPSTSTSSRSPSTSPAGRTSSPPMAGFGLAVSLLAILVAAIARRRGGRS